jgi:PAS domain S-box-containing protein
LQRKKYDCSLRFEVSMTRKDLYPDPIGHLAAIVQHSDDAIVSKRLDGTITSWNKGAERMFGYSSAEAVGQSIRFIIPRDRWPEEDEVLAKVSLGEIVDHYETVRQRRDGSLLDISLTVSPIKDEAGRIVGASKIARDISGRKQMEDERRRSEEVRARLLEAAQAANRSKDEFLAILSHELRTPLNAILGWSEVLRQRQADAATAERGLAAISRNVKAQVKLIDDLLDVSRIAAGRLRLEVRTVELAPVVASAIEAIGPAAAAKQIRMAQVLDPSGVVLGDADRLQQVVWNLVSNAVKFTPKGGRVQVSLSRINSHVEITVSDDGKGIAPDYLPFVFDRFSQADTSLRRHFGGLGLGLSIARELVELHGGTIEARSDGDDQGATFVVKLPHSLVHPPPPGEAREHPTAEAAGAPALPRPDLSGVLVLVVDDDAGTREVAEAILQPLGAEVLLAASAQDALVSLIGRRPDVLIADIGMPGEDGYSLIRSVRSLSARSGGATPAAALTAFARAEDGWRALDAGFQLHLAKPVEPLGLAIAVAHLAGRAGAPTE